MAKEKKKQGGKLKKHVKADTFEAVCAAIYLDAGYEILYDFLVEHFKEEALEIIEDDSLYNDYKTRLQEYYNSHGKKILKYTLIKEEGPEHDKLFTMAVKEGNRTLATGMGKNKKKAEQDAAKNAYEMIKNG